MKKLLALISIATLLALPAQAQTSTNAPDILPPAVGQVIQFLTTPSTNWYASTYAIYGLKDNEFGAGVAAFYKVTDYIGAAIRLDGFGGSLYMPSGNFQLSLPVKLMNKIDLIPFAFTGVAIPLGSDTSANGATLAGIFGTGFALRLPESGNKFLPNDIVVDLEKWTNVDGLQLRAGFVWKF